MAEPSQSLLEQLETGTHISNMITNTDKKGKVGQTFENLSNRLQLLEGYWQKFSDNHGKVCRDNADLVDTLDYFTQGHYYEIEDVYVTAKTDLAARLAKLAPAADGGPGGGAARTPVVQVLPTPSPLPSLKLPTFNGEQRSWDSFKELFTSMVKDVPHIANVQKLQRLISTLEGSAAARLKNLPQVGSNFEVAWNILLQSYDNNRVKLADHLKRLLSMTPMATRSAPELTRLLDTVEEATRSLTTLGRPVDQWDDWLIQLVEMRLDSQTREDWEKSIENREGFPLYKDLKAFLEHRSRTLQAASTMEAEQQVSRTNPKKPSHSARAHSTQMAPERRPGLGKTQRQCAICQGPHQVAWCSRFKDSSLEQRRKTVHQHNLCYNCLYPGHSAGNCPSTHRCRANGCGALHHTLLHDSTKSSSPTSTPAPGDAALPVSVASLHSRSRRPGAVLLATARVTIRSSSGEEIVIRALLDQGSETSFLSERVVQALKMKKRTAHTMIRGIGGYHGIDSPCMVNAQLQSTTSSFNLRFTALVLPKLTSMLPTRLIARANWPHLEGLSLADPEFYRRGRVDCLLGADVYPALMLEGLRKGGPQEPMAQDTALGWIISGPAPAFVGPISQFVQCNVTTTDDQDISTELRKFWELEEVQPTRRLSKEDQECEDHFTSTHLRDSSGRYVLRLPFARTPDLPSTFLVARARLLGSERRLDRKPKEQEAYAAFMKEYEDLNHMERIERPDLDGSDHYYIPHHAVFKTDGSGKIRVVFNASQAASSGLSLNDCLHAGPKLQTDISVILTRWRFHRYVFSADIVKMFRQFRINQDDADWLRILWRNAPDRAIQHYRLTTVTYGTACAPFQAIRTLLQLASDERGRFPAGAAILERNVYVDDALAGADTLAEAKTARDQLVGILKSAGMDLDKWSSNHPALLIGQTDISTRDRQLSEPGSVSTLGLRWSPRMDTFGFRVKDEQIQPPSTKREMLSVVARLFDPVGWLGPVIIQAKILIQRLWIRGCGWDDHLDTSTLAECRTFCQQLRDVEGISIPRFLGGRAGSPWYLHGFADASELAYGACLYVVVQDSHGVWRSTLLTAKTKVAPIKSISVPRLELCATLLLARLVASLRPQLLPEPSRTFCWSDSTVVLAWLREHPSRWQTFVANRVSEIHTLIPQTPWSHVRTEDNPADSASRGLSPGELRESSLWWNGPAWLLQDWSDWTPQDCEYTSTREAKTPRPVLAHLAQADEGFPFLRFSSLQRLLHTVAYMLRWLGRHRGVIPQCPHPKLEAGEISAATHCVIRLAQREAYAEELRYLSKRDPLPRSSTIQRCVPFLDENGVLRVGGRLQNTALPFEEKHPAIIPRGSHLAGLIVRDAHLRSLHGGPQLTLSCIRRRFWIPQVRSDVRHEVRRCTRCTRFQGPLLEQQMAPLPAARGTPSRPFSTCGLDYAGPFLIRTSKGRGQRAAKGYLAVFVCFATRAVHLEVVSDLTTQTFLAAWRRFVGRRGLCHTVWSDNGTTFQGAEQELRRLFDEAAPFNREVAETLANEGTTWRFIPPRAPHFGGLWEAGVRSFKHHLKRVIGESKLTFEEFSTLAVQIEACLNSRPLSPLSSNVEDLAALTPGHFLIGSALLAPPEPGDIPDIPRVERYRLATVMRNHFWMRWRKEVLHEYQLRSKWLTQTSPLKVGDLVLITDINTPATRWPLGRVLKLHQGSDGLERVATVRTATTTLDRPFVKLIRLPIDDVPGPGEQTPVKVGGGRPQLTANRDPPPEPSHD